MEALNGYDPALGFRFTTYATWIVRRKLISELVSTYPVKVSDHVRRKWRELEESPETLAKKMAGENEPSTVEEFFERLGETSDVDISQLHERPEDSPFVPCELASPSDSADTSNLTEEVRVAVKALSPLEQKVILSRHYREPAESYVSIARRLHVSKSSAREAYEMAVTKLRRHFHKETR